MPMRTSKEFCRPLPKRSIRLPVKRLFPSFKVRSVDIPPKLPMLPELAKLPASKHTEHANKICEHRQHNMVRSKGSAWRSSVQGKRTRFIESGFMIMYLTGTHM